MNDLELMYLLEEEGYEPSFENLAILKEDQALLEGIVGKAMNAHRLNKANKTATRDDVIDLGSDVPSEGEDWDAAIGDVQYKNKPGKLVKKANLNIQKHPKNEPHWNGKKNKFTALKPKK